MKTITEYEAKDIDTKDPRNATLALGLVMAVFILSDKKIDADERTKMAVADFLNLLNHSGYTIIKEE